MNMPHDFAKFALLGERLRSLIPTKDSFHSLNSLLKPKIRIVFDNNNLCKRQSRGRGRNEQHEEHYV